jgi:hypothetical protein
MPLHTLTREDDATLHWRQPSSWQFRFLLVADGDREFATVDWRSSWRSEGRAVMGERAWTFDHEGFWKPRVLVRDDAHAQPVAALEITNAVLQNRAELRRGETLLAEWRLETFTFGRVVWRDAKGEPLITFRSGTDEGGPSSWLRTQCRVDFTDAGFAHPERDLLVCLGWYLTVSVSQLGA